MVYIISQEGKPLMPTKRFGKVRRLLKHGLACVVQREPFTIRLQYETTEYTQSITLGVDAGSKVIGLSATTEKEELYASEVTLRTDITGLLSERRQYRRTRRNRLRYRKPRFHNRVGSKNKGWLAPSVEHKIESHIKAVRKLHKILPISKVVVEVAAFDLQKIKNPEISGTEYQEGDQLGFWNVREYVLWRDKHTCQHCKGKRKDQRLNVHHKESRQTGGDSPGNLITVCESCHGDYHEGKIQFQFGRTPSFRDASFMGIMRWACYNRLKDQYPNVSLSFGYITKNTRIVNAVSKTHGADAFCIAGNVTAKRLNHVYIQKFVCHSNRSLHKANLLKGGIRKANKAERFVKGFQLFDKVRFGEIDCFIFGRRSTGYFDLRLLDGTVVHRSANCKNLKLLSASRTLLSERKRQAG